MNFEPNQIARATASTVGNVALYTEYLNAAMEYYDINTRNRVAMFLTQATHECAHFTTLEENLSYRSADRIQAVYGKRRFPTIADAQTCVRNPQELANRVYGGRYGNGDYASGDGWRYRGRGIFQLTFFDNYKRAGEGTGMVLIGGDNPGKVAQPVGAVWTACWYWHDRDCNAHADADNLEANTKAINGGLNGYEDGNDDGLDDRVELYAHVCAKLDEMGVL